jgi:hypothetical protein
MYRSVDDTPSATSEPAPTSSAVTVQDLARFAEDFGDLDDPDVMSGAWE